MPATGPEGVRKVRSSGNAPDTMESRLKSLGSYSSYISHASNDTLSRSVEFRDGRDSVGTLNMRLSRASSQPWREDYLVNSTSSSVAWVTRDRTRTSSSSVKMTEDRISGIDTSFPALLQASLTELQTRLLRAFTLEMAAAKRISRHSMPSPPSSPRFSGAPAGRAGRSGAGLGRIDETENALKQMIGRNLRPEEKLLAGPRVLVSEKPLEPPKEELLLQENAAMRFRTPPRRSPSGLTMQSQHSMKSKSSYNKTVEGGDSQEDSSDADEFGNKFESPRLGPNVNVVQLEAEDMYATCTSHSFFADPVWTESPGSRRTGPFLQSNESIVGPTSESIRNRWVFHPDSGPRMIFLVIGVCLIFFDMILLPLAISGLVPDTLQESVGLVCLSLIYWSTDTCLNFLTGYHKELHVEMRLPHIVRHYLRGWFACDVVTVLLDAMILLAKISEAGGGGLFAGQRAVGVTRLIRLVRIARAVRIIRLGRLMRMSSQWFYLLGARSGEGIVIVARVARLVIFILVMNHYIACAWYALIDIVGPEHPRWIDELLGESSSLFHYASAFHWSLTQFTPSTQNLHPKNVYERTFAAIVVLIALLTFSTFLGKMTSAMSQLLDLNSNRRQEQVALRRFFNQNRLSEELRYEIWQCWKMQTASRTFEGVSREDVPYLANMPLKIQISLEVELFKHHICKLKIFEITEMHTTQIMPAICHFCISEHQGRHLEDVFLPHTDSYEALYILDGEMRYECRYLRPTYGALTVSPGEWVAEGALWGHWVHRGWLMVETPCRWFALNGKAFRTQVQGFMTQAIGKYLRAYALGFAQLVKSGEVFDVIHNTEEAARRSDLAHASAPLTNQVSSRSWQFARVMQLARSRTNMSATSSVNSKGSASMAFPTPSI